MIIPAAWPQCLDFFGTPLVIEPSPGQLSSDAGLFPVRQFDQRIGLTRSFADALDDPRDPDRTEHTYIGYTRGNHRVRAATVRERLTAPLPDGRGSDSPRSLFKETWNERHSSIGATDLAAG